MEVGDPWSALFLTDGAARLRRLTVDRALGLEQGVNALDGLGGDR